MTWTPAQHEELVHAPPQADGVRPAREFALMLSRRCNLTCRHCGIESSPRVRDRMALEDAERFIVEAAALPDFGKVTFTGGEPTLIRRDLLVLLDLTRRLGLQSRIVTNGGWARTRDKGLSFLGALKAAGLGEVNFSADRFHLEFAPAQTLRNALDCAAELGYPRIVSFVSNGDQDPLAEFAQLYGVERDRLLDLREVTRQRLPLHHLQDDYIFVYYGALIGLGRAATHPEDLRWYPADFFPPGKVCGEVVNKPVLYPDGSFQACCCAGGKISAFTVGNAFDTSVAELYDAMAARSHFRFITTHGPRKLYDIMRAATPERALPQDYTSICEMCVRATDGVAAEVVDRVVDSYLVEEMLGTLLGDQPVDA
ncbi:radical SAM protein [Arsenicicoccus piscis]|uniref:Radical SAM core domain-containing protein n=1 Tax=Arsenicicoccus piscis TaxID=673954 RepID=A0ABQ6HLV8_9MICO|nr:radical SAM protein [Arsenicicoccus piscis]MCH8626962.1 radical SAM protein [Arsenicicoccus piscis]GMA19115.1 hypothetical protein GCM10025862_11360 [Arsenicicoccus piscis]